MSAANARAWRGVQTQATLYSRSMASRQLGLQRRASRRAGRPLGTPRRLALRAGLVLTLGKDNQLRLVEPRTFMIRRTLTAPGFAAAGTWSTACLRWKPCATAAQRAARLVAAGLAAAWLVVPVQLLTDAGPGCRSPNEESAAAGGADGAVYLWSTGSGALAARLDDPRRRHVLVGCAWSPAGLPLASCDKSGDVTFWAGAA